MDEQYMNEQENRSWGETVSQPAEERSYNPMPFADSVYEVPHEPVYNMPVKRRKKKKRTARVLVSLLLAVVLSFVLFNAHSGRQAAADFACLFGFGGIPAVSAETLYYLRSFGVLFAAGFFAFAESITSLIASCFAISAATVASGTSSLSFSTSS